MRHDIWTLTKLEKDDPRNYLEILLFAAHLGKIQTIKYNDNVVYVISEEQYQKLMSLETAV